MASLPVIKDSIYDDVSSVPPMHIGTQALGIEQAARLFKTSSLEPVCIVSV